MPRTMLVDELSVHLDPWVQDGVDHTGAPRAEIIRAMVEETPMIVAKLECSTADIQAWAAAKLAALNH